MGMVVQHNLTAMNSNRMLGVTTSQQAKSTEKLSSGFKINRAADDAAGLAISEKMRKQIKGLTQASDNAQDGISAVQTAEGALAEVHDMLQRMNQLAVKSANETNSESDRAAIQSEVDQLTTEIDRVSQTTKFNETYLLKGDGTGKVKTAIAATAAFDGAATTYAVPKGAELEAGTLNIGKIVAEVGSTKTNMTASVDSETLSGDALTFLDDEANTDGAINVKWVKDSAADKEDGYFQIGKSGSETGKYSASDLKSMGINVSVTDRKKDGNVTIQKKLELNDDVQKAVTVTGTTTAAQIGAAKLKVGSDVNKTIKVEDGEATIEDYDPTYAPKALNFSLHVGADSDATNKISVDIKSMSAAGLGLLDNDGQLKVNGKDDTNATAAIDTIAAAIQKVSSQRSDLGAIQNRLEHTIKNLDNVVENTTAAESQIRDTDMAEEMVNFSKNNILAQAGQSMLAQANQSNQGVLSLLG